MSMKNKTKNNFKKSLKNLNLELKKLKIFKNLFLILGFGKFGKIALKYALNSESNFLIFIVDREKPSIIDSNEFLNNIVTVELIEIDLFENKKINQILSDFKNKKLFKSNFDKNRKFVVYYIKCDIDKLPELIFNIFKKIPEFIIPTIPIHILATFVYNLLLYKIPNIKINSDPIVTNFIYRLIPNNIIFKFDPSNGIILLSYAHENEICPENCPAPINYCPNFKREKPQPITQVLINLKSNPYIISNDINGFILESHPLKPGLGGFFGFEFKKIIYNFIKLLNEKFSYKNIDLENYKIRIFLSTSCNCHGVVSFSSIFFSR